MPGTLRRRDLSAITSARLGVSRAEADAALGAVLRCIQEALEKGDRVVLTGFGAFEVREVRERRVRSVQRGGGVVRVPAHKRVGFVPGAELKSALNGRSA